jgi:hypothetical protein
MIPKGSYINSAKNISIINNVLSCELASINGLYVFNKKYIRPDELYDNINGVLTPMYYNNSYFITIGNQLGNCLRIITSGLIIAKQINKNAFICMNNKTSLLEKEKYVISYIFRQYLLFDDIEFYNLDYNQCVNYDQYYGTNYDLINEGIFNYKIIENQGITKYGIINSIYSIIPEDMTIENFIIEKIKIYKSLTLPVTFIDNINNFVMKHNLNNTIGVHIRYTDNLNDNCKKDLNTPYHIFLEKINSINPTINILLCSDNQDILNNFKTKQNIIFADTCLNPNFQPLYEMYLLSNCKHIIGTNSSTFSYESAFIKGTNIELFINNEWKIYELEKYNIKI